MSTEAIIFDTETSDKDEPEIIEAGWIEVGFGSPTTLPFEGMEDRRDAKLRAIGSIRLMPSMPIKLGAMATHHIMDEDLSKCEPSSSLVLPPSDFLIGHNVDFDWKAASSHEVKRICTLAMARELWPEADSHSLSALIYLLDRKNARERLKHAHGALPDCWLCKTVLDSAIAITGVQSWDELWKFSEAARVPKIMAFGKHKGTAIKDVPSDYKRWLLNQPDVDQYLRKALTA